MKNAIIILIALLSFSCSHKDKLKESDVPTPVKDAFHKLYADITKAEWEKKGPYYEVEFDLKEVETSILLNSDGAVIETEVEIKKVDLPKIVADSIAKRFPNKELKEVSKVTCACGKVTYEVEIEKVDYIFDSEGELENIAENTVPEAVKIAFAKLYPNVKKAKWENEDGNYEVKFYTDNADLSLVIDAKGAVQKTVARLSSKELPTAITEYMTKNNKAIVFSAKITNAEGKIVYRVKTSNEKYIFDEKGTLIENTLSDVPAEIKATLTKQFPKAEEVEWVKEGDNYEAEFEIDDIEMTAVIDATGKLLDTELKLEADKLPEAVKSYLSKNLTGKKVDEAAKITSSEGKITFEAEVGGKDYIFDEKGNLIK